MGTVKSPSAKLDMSSAESVFTFLLFLTGTYPIHQFLSRPILRVQFNLRTNRIIRAHERLQRRQRIKRALIRRLVNGDIRNPHAILQRISHPRLRLQLLRRLPPRSLQFIYAPFVRGHAGGVGQILERPVCRLDSFFILEIELKNNIRSVLVDILHHVRQRGDCFFMNSPRLIAQV
ncbi:hypothetical protein JI435_304130 [Parastagonospora nodorum SN15]|uniref:Uncharacterized protein n=1 Tax=Phaeosphaeria nodorum (strain SN15 / ATCC MYA-4574 / FGSC 10173) TaxID=321614 RepID=A0A7U2NPA4_PHANO|nr:hypothetical protein JI435_304130 [Parastagonospora nodorum SN15]